jgi:hypothetical protein
MNDTIKVHTVKVRGCELITNLEEGAERTIGMIFIGGLITLMAKRESKIKRITFSPTSFCTDKSINFNRCDVKRIAVLESKNKIEIFCEKKERK